MDFIRSEMVLNSDKASNKINPKVKQSALKSYTADDSYSGALYKGVPTFTEYKKSLSSTMAF